PALRADRGAGEESEEGRADPPSRTDEPRRRDRERGGRRALFGHPRPGDQRRGRADGGAAAAARGRRRILSRLLLKGGRVVDPARRLDAPRDVLLEDGRVARVEKSLSRRGAEVIEAEGLVVCPGFID